MSKIQHDQVGALERLKHRRDKQSQVVASRSHTQNDLYMDNFAEGLRHLEIEDGAPSKGMLERQAARSKKRDDSILKSSTAGHGAPVTGESSRAHAHSGGAALGYNSHLPGTVADGWIAGPINETGTALHVSDRPILCSAANWKTGEIVVGSSDHALYVLDVQKCTQKRCLHTKTSGHREWVTCVTYLQDGSILSGSMDSQLCLWTKGTSRSKFLTGHSGSISQICTDKTGLFAVSASYDKTLRLWNSNGSCQGRLEGHSAPILELQTDNGGRMLSGDRAGTARLWDIETSVCTWELKNVHKGHVTSVAWADASGGNMAWLGCFATGGQDGRLRLWDPRAHDNVAKLELHGTKTGKGAVSGIVFGGAASGYMAATCGADLTLRILDSRGGMGELACVPLSDYPYSFTAAGGLLIVGCSNGTVQVIDSHVIQTQYSLNVSSCAIRSLEVSKDRLVCSGDAGFTVFYSFAGI